MRAYTPRPTPTFTSIDPEYLPTDAATMHESTMFVRLSAASECKRPNDTLIAASFDKTKHVENWKQVSTGLWSVKVEKRS